MGRAPTTTADPTLDRLREVAERIRRRAAEGRARQASRPLRPPPPVRVQWPERPSPPPPRHWSDGPADDGEHR